MTHQRLRHFAWMTLVFAVSCSGATAINGGGNSSGGSAGSAAGSGDAGALNAGGAAPLGPCDQYGLTREAPCGRCGTQAQSCASDGQWSNIGTCSGEGECAAGVTDTRSTATCVTETRTCSAACTWGTWGPGPAPECSPGETSYDNSDCPKGLIRRVTCDNDCRWIADGDCANLCQGSRRTDPPDAEEVCVPSGPFIRGDEEFSNAQPVESVFLSAFYVDRYLVTNRRYVACSDAGACPAEASSDPADGAYPVFPVTHSAAVAFCAWDEGRLVVTEAQWEKAARGPAPRHTKYLWGDNPDCLTARPASDCPQEYGSTASVPFTYAQLTTMTGFYGTELMSAALVEWTRDNYTALAYSDSASTTDPFVSWPGNYFFTMRGSDFATTPPWPIGHRIRGYDESEINPDWPGSGAFRCARPTQDAN
jgi:formylglycine-generating enzyme required for sulfatase activity